MGATGNIARLEQRFLRELSLPFPFQPFSIARISIISSMISQTSRVNRIFFAPISFPPPPIGLFETLPVSNTENAGLLDDGFYSTSCFYSSPSVLNILPSRQRLHRYFARITISPDSLFAVETEWNAAFYVVIFVQVPRCFRRKLFSASIVRTFRVKI